MPSKRILILGGTGLARDAANALVARGQNVVTSLAGVTAAPHLPSGDIRKGGFGGAAGLTAYLARENFDQVIDATHAFAARMSDHAAQACVAAGVRIIRLQAPEWQAQAGDDWQSVANIGAALAALPAQARICVTVGRKEIGAFFARADLAGVARMIERPDVPVPPLWTLRLERPPFTLAGEIELLRANGIQFLVSKNAGGARAAKLDAAAALGLRVIMVARPEKPAAETVASVEELLGRVVGKG